MSQLRKTLRTLTALAAALAILACAVPATLSAAAENAAEETQETVSSYPYTTTTKDKVNLRASRSTRGALVKKIPAGAEITVKSVKGSWAAVDYKDYSGYVMTDYIVLKEVKKVKVTPTPTPVPTLTPEEDAGGYQILKNGDSGEAVTALQEALIELGFLSGTADGKFGSGTEKAVIAFQQANEYPATGIMDANIQAFLYSGTVKNASGAKTNIKTLSPVKGVSMKKGNTGSLVTKLQNRLIALGYLKGKASGTYDADTIAAVRAFQKKNGLTSNGTANGETQDLLYSDAAINASATPTPAPTATPKPTAEPTPTPAIPTEALSRGAKGDSVKTLQQRLKDLKYYKGNVDGKFGDATSRALKAFQEAHGLTADGVAGKATYAILFSDNALVKGTTPTPAVSETPAAEEATPTPAATEQTWPTLKKNDSGDNVAQLQEALIQLGYLTGKADGNYGAATAEAVKAFQKANGLTVDGSAGAETQKALYGGKAKAKPTPTPTPTPKASETAASSDDVLQVGSTGSEVKDLQNKLIELGYLKGKADGVFGAKTAQAVKDYQKANKLTADGIAGAKTLDSLKSKTGTAANSSTSETTAAAAAATASVSTKISASSVQYAGWYETVKAVCQQYPYATVYDYSTGISWQVHIFSVGAHADYEPVTANDTAKMEKAFGGNTWTPKAVWVKFSNGSVYLGSTHSMPHDVQHITDNNFAGHSCLHFPRSREKVEAIGPYATKHQDTEEAGWIATQKLK